MDLTKSWLRSTPAEIHRRYVWQEVRNAAMIIASTNPQAWQEILEVLDGFELRTDDLTLAGGQESDLAARINTEFRARGWREARVDTEIELVLALMRYQNDPETQRRTKTKNRGFKVDNFRGRVALDVEWNAKDGNLSRDIAAYRALYEYGLIDAAVIITRTQPDLRALAYTLALEAGLGEVVAKKRLGTTTTTNLDKLLPMMTRGDSGGCPLLAVAICRKTWDGDSSFITERPISDAAWRAADVADDTIPDAGASPLG